MQFINTKLFHCVSYQSVNTEGMCVLCSIPILIGFSGSIGADLNKIFIWASNSFLYVPSTQFTTPHRIRIPHEMRGMHTTAGRVRGFGIVSSTFHNTSRSKGTRGDPSVLLNLSRTSGSWARRFVCSHNCCDVLGKYDICSKTSRKAIASSSISELCSALTIAPAILLSKISLQKHQYLRKQQRVSWTRIVQVYHWIKTEYCTFDSLGTVVCMRCLHSLQLLFYEDADVRLCAPWRRQPKSTKRAGSSEDVTCHRYKMP